MRKLYSLALLGLLISAGVVFAMDLASDSSDARGRIKGRVSPEFLEGVAKEGDIKSKSTDASSRSAEIMEEKGRLNNLLLKGGDGVLYQNLSERVLEEIFGYILVSEDVFDFNVFAEGLAACRTAEKQYDFLFKTKAKLKLP